MIGEDGDGASVESHERDGSRVSKEDGNAIEYLTEDQEMRVKMVRAAALSSYSISKWLMSSALKEEIVAIQNKFRTIEVSMGQGAGINLNISKSVSDYWESTNSAINQTYSKPAQLQAVQIVQCIARFWLKLKEMRKSHRYLGFSMESKATAVQVAVRKFHDVREVRNLQAKKLMERDLFGDFCSSMVKGVPIRMFSRKHGTLEMRILKFSDDCKSVTYVTKRFAPKRSFEIKHIFKVAKNLSSNIYPQARAKHKNWCFHIHLIGPQNGRLLDFEPINHSDSKLLFYGFSQLSKLASSQSPFYIDKMGVPSRAVGSIVRCVLKEGTHGAHNETQRNKYKGCTSDADLMRFRSAVRDLSREYVNWGRQKGEEERLYMQQIQERLLATEEDHEQTLGKSVKKKLIDNKVTDLENQWNATTDYSSDEDLSVDDYKDTEIQFEELSTVAGRNLTSNAAAVITGPSKRNVKSNIRFFEEGNSHYTISTNHAVRIDPRAGLGIAVVTATDDGGISAASLGNDGVESETSFDSDCSGSEDTIKIDAQLPGTRTTVESKGIEHDITLSAISHQAGMYKCTWKHGAWIKSEPEISAANVGVLNFGDDILVTEFVMTSIEEPDVKYAKLYGGGWVRLNKDTDRIMTHHSELSM